MRLSAELGTALAQGSPRQLRMLFFLDYDDGAGGRFINSPGLLPFVGQTRAAGFDVEFVSSKEALLEALASPDVDVVGVSSMERMLPRSVATAREVRARRPDVVLMIGGSSIDPFGVELAAGLFDVVVVGEGEHALPALLRVVAGARGLSPGRPAPGGEPRLLDGPVRKAGEAQPGGALSPELVDRLLRASFLRTGSTGEPYAIRVGNVYVRDCGRRTVWHLAEPDPPADGAVETGTAPLERELEATCVLPWDVFAQEGWKHFEFYAQRGCRWGRCNFCSVGSREVRVLPPERVVEVIAEATARGVEMVSFADDLFIQQREWLGELLERLQQRGIKTRLRAQTMANSTIWPFLEPLRGAGFTEICYGLETLDPRRAETIGKSFNGEKYVEHAKETVRRTAMAGIFPTLYLIMIDPSSTLLQTAAELEATVRFVADVYEATGVVPVLSYSLAMLPVAATRLSARFEHSTTRIPLQQGELCVPAEFKFSDGIRRYLMRIDRETEGLPRRRDNLAALARYLESVASVARELGGPDVEEIRARSEGGLEALRRLLARLDLDAEESARALYEQSAQQEVGALLASRRFDYGRFGGYVAGVERFCQQLDQLLQSGAEEP